MILFVLVIVVLIFLYAIKPDTTEVILGIYRLEKGRFYYAKYYIAYTYLKVKIFLFGNHSDSGFIDSDENVKILTFYGSAENNSSFIYENGYFYLRLPEVTNKLLHYTDPENPNLQVNIFDTGSSVVNRNEGQILFEGQMRDSDSKPYEVKITANWSAILPIFQMYHDMSATNFSRSIARELWSHDYFETLQIFVRQQILAQYGELEAKLDIDGTIYSKRFNCSSIFFNGESRFKSFLYRYVLHHIRMEDGSSFCFGVASFTQQFSSIPIGYMFSIENCKNYPIQFCDLQLHKFGEESRLPPTVYSYISGTRKSLYNTIVRTKEELRFTQNDEYGRKIIDPSCTFEINGKVGYGNVVWYYRK